MEANKDLCYECQTFYPLVELQDRPCSLCEGYKCKKIHGGQVMHTCEKCGVKDLCFDCSVFAKCCMNYSHETGFTPK